MDNRLFIEHIEKFKPEVIDIIVKSRKIRAKWIGEEVWSGGNYGEESCCMECSNCHKVRPIDIYCSNCGAKMEMEKKDG